MSSRREFIKAVSVGALAALSAQSLPGAVTEAPISVPGKEGLIVRSYRFLDLEAPVEFMTDWITPSSRRRSI